MANPILKNMEEIRELTGEPMTVNGAINKTFMLLACLILAAGYTWILISQGFTDKANILAMGGGIIGFILALIICFTRKGLNVLTPLYSICEGFFIGGVSAIYAAQYAGIVIQAVLATFATLATMLILYRTKTIQATDKFRSVVFTATLSIALIYLIQFIAGFFGRGIPQIFTASAIGIGFSVIVVTIAALNLIIDFDFIENGANGLLSKEYEWYGAFGLMISLIWLYLEILRLLAKVSSRR